MSDVEDLDKMLEGLPEMMMRIVPMANLVSMLASAEGPPDDPQRRATDEMTAKVFAEAMGLPVDHPDVVARVTVGREETARRLRAEIHRRVEERRTSSTEQVYAHLTTEQLEKILAGETGPEMTNATERAAETMSKMMGLPPEHPKVLATVQAAKALSTAQMQQELDRRRGRRLN